MYLFILHIPKFVINENGFFVDLYNNKIDISNTFIKNDILLSSYLLEEDELEEVDFKLVIIDILKKMDITNIKIIECQDNRTLELKFTVININTEYILNSLLSIGIGEQIGNIWVLPLDITRPNIQVTNLQNHSNKFIETIKARLVIDKIAEITNVSAQLSFDYISLVIIASILAFLGLAYNNITIIVASMLVSPIMGPVTAVTFGTIIKDWKLVKTGFKSELSGLIICVIIGFLFGLIMGPFENALSWPTEEMENRGNIKGLLSGIFVAIPSGIGVALSILGNNTSSLVGVAISASLLPPAVNTGILFSIASTAHLYINKTIIVNEILTKALISFSLTIANIIVIYLMGMAMFKIKEVAKIPGKTKFWKDIELSRNYDNLIKNENNESYNNIIDNIIPILNENLNIPNLNNNIIDMNDKCNIKYYYKSSSPKNNNIIN